ncbi:MAG: hypothetical protein KME31_37530 [Tolypothrix carrinoi HA7290-LM1]|nr:hypothetical protein [Tolypothrix carrinoi HA7290-LM1]
MTTITGGDRLNQLGAALVLLFFTYSSFIYPKNWADDKYKVSYPRLRISCRGKAKMLFSPNPNPNSTHFGIFLFNYLLWVVPGTGIAIV